MIDLTDAQMDAARHACEALEAACTEMGGLAEHLDRRPSAINRWTYLDPNGHAQNQVTGCTALVEQNLVEVDWEGGKIVTYRGTPAGNAALARLGAES